MTILWCRAATCSVFYMLCVVVGRLKGGWAGGGGVRGGGGGWGGGGAGPLAFPSKYALI